MSLRSKTSTGLLSLQPLVDKQVYVEGSLHQAPDKVYLGQLGQLYKIHRTKDESYTKGKEGGNESK